MPRFRLRTLILAILVLCSIAAWFCLKWQAAERQRKAVDSLEQIGMMVVDYDFEVDSDWQPTGKENPSPQWLAKLLGQDFLANVVAVWVSAHQDKQAIGNDALLAIRQLSYVQEVSLSGTAISGEAVTRLAELGRLEVLDLSYTNVGDTEIAAFGKLARLESLALAGTRITDRSMPVVGRLKRLVILDISGTEVSDAGLQHLHGCSELTLVVAHETKVTAQGALSLRRALPQCEIEVEAP